MDGAKILPFGGAHFVACYRGAGRGVGEESDNYGVCLLNQEAAKFVEPNLFRGVLWWVCKLSGQLGGYWCSGRRIVRVREGVV